MPVQAQVGDQLFELLHPGFGSGGDQPFIGEPRFGLPTIESAEGFGRFLPFGVELGGCRVHRLFELEAAVSKRSWRWLSSVRRLVLFSSSAV